MKQSYPLLFFIFMVAMKMTAQPTLNQNNGFQDGSYIELFVDLAPSLNEGSSGSNQVWDFSSLSSSDLPTVFDGVLASTTPFVEDFSSAQLASMSVDFSGDIIYNYFSNEPDHYSNWGYESTSQKLVYINPLEILHYPFTYGNSFTDTYFGNLTLGYNSGSVTITADAYGSLILPTGLFYNCLRVREVRIDTFSGNMNFITSNDTSYKFYVKNYPEPLCQVNYHHTSNGFDFKEIYWQNVQPSGIPLLNGDKLLLSYPNPCKDLLNVLLPFHDEELQAKITDASGRQMKVSFSFERTILQINTSSLTEGIYFLTVETKNGSLVNSFLKSNR